MGTSDAPVAFQSDAQMSSRFTPFEIPRWTESDDFRRLLRAFEQTLPLRRASDLEQPSSGRAAADRAVLDRRQRRAAGRLSRLLNAAAEQAIRRSATAASASRWASSSGPPMRTPESPWPVAPRPFPDEAFGSWFGRLAGRYHLWISTAADATAVVAGIVGQLEFKVDTPTHWAPV